MSLSPIQKFHNQRGAARRRGIPFLLTFDEWWRIWKQSGHWHERGCGRGKYQMARLSDCGAYEPGNVKIIRHEQNRAEQKFSARTRAKLAVASLGRHQTPEAIAKMLATRRANQRVL